MSTLAFLHSHDLHNKSCYEKQCKNHKNNARYGLLFIIQSTISTTLTMLPHPTASAISCMVIRSSKKVPTADTITITAAEAPKISSRLIHFSSFLDIKFYAPSVAAITAFMVCILFSASSNTTDCSDSNTSSVTSISLRLKRSPISFPIFVSQS